MSFDQNFLPTVLHLIWIIPLFASVCLALSHGLQESFVSRVTALLSGISALVSVVGVFAWMNQASGGLAFRALVLPHWIPGHLEILMRMDSLGALFSGLTSFFQLIIVRFSRVYLHREEGYNRFFSLIFLLTTGMQFISLADNLEVFFLGWESIGLASFFLVAFYRRQERSATNALKIFSVYRIGDLGLVLTMVILNMLPGLNPGTPLSEIRGSLLAGRTMDPLLFCLFLGLIAAACAKSAQFPFTFWLPKAMEGPTPSSAIFYGALSVHAGALLILRLQPLWSVYPIVSLVIGVVGFMTIIFGIGSGRVQTSIKGQLAYASAVQVGFIFIEIACGWTAFATFHIASHALYRSLQLIVSPSIITHLMTLKANDRDAGGAKQHSMERWLPRRIRHSLYVLAIQENYLEHVIDRLILFPLRAYKSQLNSLGFVMNVSLIVTALGSYILGPTDIAVYSLIGFALSLSFQAAVERDSPNKVINRVILTIMALATACYAVANGDERTELVSIVTAIFPFWLWLKWALRDEGLFNLRQFCGLFGLKPVSGWFLFIAMGAIIGLPPLPGFFFEDLLMSTLMGFGANAALMAGAALALAGIAGFRVCGLVTMGEPTPALLARYGKLDRLSDSSFARTRFFRSI